MTSLWYFLVGFLWSSFLPPSNLVVVGCQGGEPSICASVIRHTLRARLHKSPGHRGWIMWWNSCIAWNQLLSLMSSCSQVPCPVVKSWPCILCDEGVERLGIITSSTLMLHHSPERSLAADVSVLFCHQMENTSVCHAAVTVFCLVVFLRIFPFR